MINDTQVITLHSWNFLACWMQVFLKIVAALRLHILLWDVSQSTIQLCHTEIQQTSSSCSSVRYLSIDYVDTSCRNTQTWSSSLCPFAEAWAVAFIRGVSRKIALVLLRLIDSLSHDNCLSLVVLPSWGSCLLWNVWEGKDGHDKAV
jgi:hypothetical protein